MMHWDGDGPRPEPPLRNLATVKPEDICRKLLAADLLYSKFKFLLLHMLGLRQNCAKELCTPTETEFNLPQAVFSSLRQLELMICGRSAAR
jgi:hypothetical protein